MFMARRCLAFRFLLLSILPISLLADDWPQWQGPHRDGLSAETDLLQDWPAGGPPLLWKIDKLGGGYSAPAIAGGRIYGMSYRGGDEVVWALEEATGKPAWSSRIAAADRAIGYAEGSRSTPTVEADRLYVLGAGGTVACLEKTTGKVLWQKNLIKDFGGRMMSDWGYSESPLVDGDRLVCTPGGPHGTVLALQKQTGNKLWQSEGLKDNASYASLIKVETGGIPQYVVLTDASVAGIAATDGKVLWRASRPGRTAVITTPIFHDNCVFVTSDYTVGCNLFRITSASGGFRAEEVYANKAMENHHGGVLLIGDYLYGHSENGGWVCLEFKTGKVMWKERSKFKKGAIGYADGRCYLRAEGSRGTVALMEPTPKGYIEKGRFDQPDRSDKNSWPHPVIANGRLYLRDQDILLCYDVKKK